MRIFKRLRNELIEILLFLVLFGLVGTWMTVHHQLRDVSDLMAKQQSIVTELSSIRTQLISVAPKSQNRIDIDRRLAVESARLNAHIVYFNQVLSTQPYQALSRFHAYQPVAAYDVTPPLASTLEVSVVY